MKPEKIKESDVTDFNDYINRKSFLKKAGAVATAGVLTPAAYYLWTLNKKSKKEVPLVPKKQEILKAPVSQNFAQGEKLTKYEYVTGYNNFYEFTTDKEDVAQKAASFITKPWTIKIGGEVDKPGLFDVTNLIQTSDLEERIYRFRCVEGWSMVIPWIGIPFYKIMQKVIPNSFAKYVKFTTLYDPEQMPGQRRRILEWPYVEGLRLDEALHPLTLLAVGLYGKILPNQNGAPVRLVVPWKYGFKSIKSIVNISFTRKQPVSSWMMANPSEYGFYSNVNPNVDHPRWSQKMERRIGSYKKIETLMFNGYAKEVAGLYANMDLKKDY